jgi:probable rRNA maturation factor
MINVQIANEQDRLPLDEERLRKALCVVLEEAGVTDARVSVAVVDDPTIARLNEQFLRHQGPTDVLSFLLEQGPGTLEGEVVASAETAARAAPEYGWPPQDELLLYVIHGALHLAGHDDATPAQRARMRRREREVLNRLDMEGRYEERRKSPGRAREPGIGNRKRGRTPNT